MHCGISIGRCVCGCYVSVVQPNYFTYLIVFLFFHRSNLYKMLLGCCNVSD